MVQPYHRGTIVSVSTHSAHFNDKVYEDPLRFDEFLFSKMREGSANEVGMVPSSQDHLRVAFGLEDTFVLDDILWHVSDAHVCAHCNDL